MTSGPTCFFFAMGITISGVAHCVYINVRAAGCIYARLWLSLCSFSRRRSDTRRRACGREMLAPGVLWRRSVVSGAVADRFFPRRVLCAITFGAQSGAMNFKQLFNGEGVYELFVQEPQLCEVVRHSQCVDVQEVEHVPEHIAVSVDKVVLLPAAQHDRDSAVEHACKPRIWMLCERFQ